MNSKILRSVGLFFVAALMFVPAPDAQAQPMHGIAMYGDPSLPPDFVSLPYVNPNAPTGGRIVTGEVGSFDSLNPHILKGRVPWQLRYLAYESLMGRNWDEPFSLYGLLAETVETGPNREWVEFVLRKEAEFSDGTPVCTGAAYALAQNVNNLNNYATAPHGPWMAEAVMTTDSTSYLALAMFPVHLGPVEFPGGMARTLTLAPRQLLGCNQIHI